MTAAPASKFSCHSTPNASSHTCHFIRCFIFHIFLTSISRCEQPFSNSIFFICTAFSYTPSNSGNNQTLFHSTSHSWHLQGQYTDSSCNGADMEFRTLPQKKQGLLKKTEARK
uniref:Uncharacterized protein n=1 Tax=Triticum urartu TaxID=4572 RepID=A0A8R7UE15_TRIUA